MSIEELKDEALRLSPEGRAYLARELLASLDKMSEAEIEELWLQEAMRRDEELGTGTAQSCPADEVFSRARARRK
jgi:putative addiction module component (TIGR02574 family)